MGWVQGLEPWTYGTTTRRSSQLGYTHHVSVRSALSYYGKESPPAQPPISKIFEKGCWTAFAQLAVVSIPCIGMMGAPRAHQTAHQVRQSDARRSAAAVEQDIGHLTGTARHEELDRLVDGGHEHEQQGAAGKPSARGAPLGIERMAGAEAEGEVLAEVRRLANNEVGNPSHRKAQLGQGIAHSIEHRQAEPVAPRCGHERVTPYEADDDDGEGEPPLR